MDPGSRVVAVLTSVAVAAGTTCGCAQWQADMSRERDVPFGTGQYEGEVTARSGLNVRTEPTTDSDSLAVLANGTSLRISCRIEGQSIEGEPTWYKVGFARWVSARHVTAVGDEPPRCDD